MSEVSVTLRQRIAGWLPLVMEVVLLAMVCLAPWAYGADHPGFEFLLQAGVALLTVLWGVRILLEWKVVWNKCPVTLCLAGLFLLGIWQLTPLKKSVLEQLSPETAHLYEQLLPTQQEQLPFGEAIPSPSPPAGSTISLYPAATRIQLERILTLLLLFAVVSNNLATAAALNRLGIVVLVNGSLLALFALVQFFSSPPNVLYWRYPIEGRVFGPFLYRGHYAYYINLCLGLGLGVLWNRQSTLEETRSGQSEDPSRFHWSPSVARLLQDPVSLIIGVGLALMLSSVAMSLSRGGFLALVGGVAVCLLFNLTGKVQLVRMGTGLLILALALGFLGWFGMGRVESRLSTLWGGTALQQSRLPVWSNVLDMVKHFPLWGTGFGTYRYVDPLYRTNATFSEVVVDHLHNDHLEILVEGGIFGCLLCLFTIGLVYWLGWQAIRRKPACRGLALGAIFAFTTMLVQSVGDFGIHIPAIALLAAVFSAQLCSLGDSDNTLSTNLSWGGFVPVVAAVICVVLAWVVFSAGWRASNSESFRRAASIAGQKAVLGSLERQRDFLEAAVRVFPDAANLRTELGEVYLALYSQAKEKQGDQNKLLDISATVLLASAPLSAVSFLAMKTTGQRELFAAEESRLTREFLVPAMKHFVQARDQGPLLPGVHLGLALLAEKMVRADPSAVYMDRVQLLAPADPTLWYYCGNQELRHGQPARAWKNWRHSLELSDRHLTQILDRSSKLLTPEDLVREVLPDQPELLLSAAFRLHPRAEATAERQPFLSRALLVLSEEPQPLASKQMRTKALILQASGETDEAIKIQQKLVEREPLQLTWRYEYARMLHEEGRQQEARAELLVVLAQQPRHVQANELLTKVTKLLLNQK